MGLEPTHCSRSHRLPCGVCHGLQPTVGALFKNDRRGVESEFFRCSTVELRRRFGDLRLEFRDLRTTMESPFPHASGLKPHTSSDADGTRTHNIRLGKHGLQLGSRSCTQNSDEVWTRGTSVRESNPPIAEAIPRRTGRITWTPDRRSLRFCSEMPNEVFAETSPARTHMRPSVGTRTGVSERCRRAHRAGSPQIGYLRIVIVTMESRQSVGPYDDTADEELVRTRHVTDVVQTNSRP